MDPVTPAQSVLDLALVHRRQTRTRDSAAADSGFAIGALGSGSDYTAFIDHLGVASLNVSFGGATHDGIYHSIYDSYAFYQRFLDTSLVYGVAEAQTMATAILRLADAPVLPFEFGAAARTWRRYADEIARLASRNDSTEALDLAAVRGALARLDSAAQRYETALAPLARQSLAALTARRAALARVNEMLYRTERALSDTTGLPRRPWFRHLIYAPGFYTGYGVKTMPGIREAVEQRNLAEAQAQAARVAQAIGRYAEEVGHAADALAAALR